jgi:hypothetical protein
MILIFATSPVFKQAVNPYFRFAMQSKSLFTRSILLVAIVALKSSGSSAPPSGGADFCPGKLTLDSSGDWSVSCNSNPTCPNGTCSESSVAPGPGEYFHSWCECSTSTGEPDCCHLNILYDEFGAIQYGSGAGECNPRLGCPSGLCNAKQANGPGGSIIYTAACS